MLEMKNTNEFPRNVFFQGQETDIPAVGFSNGENNTPTLEINLF